jgi:sucrose synthase
VKRSPWIESQQVWRLSDDLTTCEAMTLEDLLNVCGRQVDRYQPYILNIDFHPFYPGSPVIDDPRNIGQDLEFLNRYLCNKLSIESEYWLEALFKSLNVLQENNLELFLNDRVKSRVELSQQVKQALKFLRDYAAEQSYEKVHEEIQAKAFMRLRQAEFGRR